MLRVAAHLLWYVAFLTLFCSHAHSKTTQHLHFLPEQITLSEQQRERIEQHFSEVLNTPVIYHSDVAADVTIRLSVVPQPDEDWLRSRYEYAAIPAFALLTLPGGISQSSEFTGVVNRPYRLRYETAVYPIDEEEAALTLLERGRISAIIDYADNAGLYTSRNKHIEKQAISSSKPVYIEFTTASAREHFETRIEQLIAENISVPFVKSASDTSRHADSTLHWILINKYFDNNQDALTVSYSDTEATQWWRQQLANNTTLQIHNMSSTAAFDFIVENANACILNVLRTEARQQVTYFSQPAVYYLDLRLYALRESEHAQLLKRQTGQRTLSLETLASTYPSLIFGYTRGAITHPVIGDIIADEPQRFINLDSGEMERAIPLLKRGRIDYMLEYPTTLHEIRRAVGDDTPLTSFALEDSKQAVPAHIACSLTERGKQHINEINAILEDPSLRKSLADVYTKGMSESEQRAYHKALSFEKLLD
ncbi:hypothetical protein [Aestuariibacter salexigens]|uniref:hypothetical protein n=1 Tax=Aestuariibacter salexigens TaxID=226010 RepID=UPI00047E1CD9|nr:hypothetical protein [Aestuariibacter salexigens]